MILGILKEPEKENRVSLLPEGAAVLKKLKAEIWVEEGAGMRAFASDQLYTEAGALVKDRASILQGADALLMIQPPAKDVVASPKQGQVILSNVNPFFNKDLVLQLQSSGKTVFSLELIPR